MQNGINKDKVDGFFKGLYCGAFLTTSLVVIFVATSTITYNINPRPNNEIATFIFYENESTEAIYVSKPSELKWAFASARKKVWDLHGFDPIDSEKTKNLSKKD